MSGLADRKSLFPFFREETKYGVWFKRDGQEWRLWSEPGSHHGASEDAATARAEGKWGEVRVAKCVTTEDWTWDD